ncbi:DMT family transporter [Sinirhodobacter populi]|uniref:DMT family transporter n=1 Tax=Paenirhodobacter populi TaxID=2306993 RepID=A0A443KJX9_9RHOB|nr:DMT family transporter [Sinirhodobacter populi]RWR33036.1 DMT family transporter [Sinirhodobacter populi]
MTQQDTRKGVMMMVAVTFIFAMQDGISRHLSEAYNTYMIVMIRYWFFALFVIAMAARTRGGLRHAIRAKRPWLQALRGILLVVQIYVIIFSFVQNGLINTHSVFICYPLIVAALSGPILGEKVGWRRWTAIAVGFVGVIIILDPGKGLFTMGAIIPLLSAVIFAAYALLTAYVGHSDDGIVSFFWTGIVGVVFATLGGMFFWEPMSLGDWGWMALLCLTATSGHYLMIRAYEMAEASALQPIAYLQLVWGSILGMWAFGDVLHLHVAIGAAITVGAGLFTIWRARVKARQILMAQKD